MILRKSIIVLALSAAIGTVNAEPQVNYLSPVQTDFISGKLAPLGAKFAEPAFDVEKETVSFSWALKADETLNTPQPYKAESSQYWLDASSKELAAGLDLNTSSRGAIVRISPTGAAAKSAISMDQVEIRQGSTRLTGQQAAAHFADEAALKSAGVDFGVGTLAFKLDSKLNAGLLTLKLNNLGKSIKDSYVVHVFEPDSNAKLSLQAASERYQLGQQVEFEVSLTGWQGKATVSDFQGYLSSQDGKDVLPLTFAVNAKGDISAYAQTTDLGVDQAGLWEANVFVETGAGKGKLLRDAKTAISLSVPSARLSGAFSVQPVERLLDGVHLDVAVEAAVAGRYEIRGVLYGTDFDGKMKPIAVSNSAAWMEAGKGELSLAFDQNLLLGAKAGAPYEVRHLSLNDQGRLQPLWYQQRAFELNDR